MTGTGLRMAERPCQVCSHPDRLAIEAALVNGQGLRELARSFGIGSGTFGTPEFRADHKKLERHRDRDMAQAYQVAVAHREALSGNALVDRMAALDAVVDESLERLRAGIPITDEHGAMLDADGRPLLRYQESTILAAVREARRNVEMHARLAGALPDGDQAAVDAARLALQSPAARRAITDLEAMLAAEAARSPEQR